MWEDRAWEEYLQWQDEDRKTLRKLNALIKEVMRSPTSGIGKPEKLKGDLSGYWSRRIDDTNRLVYRVAEEAIWVIQCKGHYDN